MYPDIQQNEYAEIHGPSAFRHGFKPSPMENAPQSGQLQQSSHDKNDANNSSSFHNLIKTFDSCCTIASAKLSRCSISRNFLGYSAWKCDEW